MKKLVICCSVLFTQYLQAQTGFTNYGSMKIHSGANIRSAGSFSNKSTANFVNNGSFYLKGNLKNDQLSMQDGTGTLVLNGATQQAIQGAAIFRTASLQTNNAAGFLLNNDLSISGVHSFQSGLISSTGNFLVYQQGSTYNGAADNKHVNGGVKKTGTTDFIFPVGNGTVMREIAVVSLSSNSTFAVQYYNTTPPGSTDLISPLHSIEGNEYWSVSRISGSDAKLLMNWNDVKVDIPSWLLSEIRVAGYDGSNWLDMGGAAIGDVSSTGSITSGLISNFNLFTLGSVSSIVPMTLHQFNGKPVNEGTLINWKTAQEKNIRKYILERSDNAILFSSINETLADNLEGIRSYQFLDRTKINGHAYYRLRTIDYDGKEKLSNTIMISGTETGSVRLVNNPLSGNINLVSNGLNGNYQYSIISNAGTVVQQGNIQLGNSRISIALNSSTRPGYYNLVLRKGTALITIPFIVK